MGGAPSRGNQLRDASRAGLKDAPGQDRGALRLVRRGGCPIPSRRQHLASASAFPRFIDLIGSKEVFHMVSTERRPDLLAHRKA